MHKLPQRLLLGIHSALFASALSAANAGDLTEIMVYADRQPVALNRTVSRAQVLDAATLATLPVRDVTDALATLPNVNLRRSGGALAEGSIGMYGRSAQPRSPTSTTLALAGIPLNNGMFPQTSLNLLPMQSVGRVEVIQGPSSALYGNNARLGVINLMPRQPDQPLLELNGTLGRWDMRSAGLTAGNRLGEAGSVLLSLERRETDGHLQPAGQADFSNSRLDNAALFASGNVSATKLEFAALHYGWARNNPSYLVQPGAPAATNPIGSPSARSEEGDRQHLQLRASQAFSDSLSGDITLMHHRFEEDTRFNASYATPAGAGATAPTSNATEASGLSVTLLHTLGNNQLTLGAEYLEGEEHNRSTGARFDGQSEALFLQNRHELFDERLTLYAAYRVDRFDYYEENSKTPRVGFVVRGNDDKWLLRGNSSRAFSAPSFNQLFGALGNPNLVATRFRVNELMLEVHPAAGLRLEAGVFDTHETDPIFPRPRNQNPSCAPGPGNCFINALDELDTKGTILALRHQATGILEWGVSYTHLRPGTSTFATAEHVLKIDANLRSGPWLASLFVQHEANRYFQDNFLSPFPDFTLVNLQASRSIGSNLSLKLLLENLTDEDYATTQIVSTNATFPALPILNPGRNLSVGVTWTY